jgi:phosphatidylethanolamine-binding protein (PEBP) family uncharacterized protein
VYCSSNDQLLSKLSRGYVAMKLKALVMLLGLAAISTSALALDVKVTDSSWNGNKIPTGQQCQKFGGMNPSTPALSLSGIPKGTYAIVMEYSDRDSENMNNGGHGQLIYALKSSAKVVEIPSIHGHTFDVPAPFEIVAPHRGPGWDKAGAYMPPCSGGKDHAYYVTVKAVDGDKVLATTVLELGKY